jgi:hypothetical protein
MKIKVLLLFAISFISFAIFSQEAIISLLSSNVMCVGDTVILSSNNSISGESQINSSTWGIFGPNGFDFTTNLSSINKVPIVKINLHHI